MQLCTYDPPASLSLVGKLLMVSIYPVVQTEALGKDSHHLALACSDPRFLGKEGGERLGGLWVN